MTDPHRCAYVLFVDGRWVSASGCHYGKTVDLPAPGLKPPTHRHFHYADERPRKAGAA